MLPKLKMLRNIFNFLNMDANPIFFFCLTSTFTNQILNQEPEFLSKQGKLGSQGYFAWICCSCTAVSSPEQEQVVPALSFLLCCLFILGISSSQEQPSQEFFSGGGRIIQWTDFAKNVSLQGLVVISDSLPGPGSYHLPLTSPTSAWISGMFEGFFKSFLASEHVLQAAGGAGV